MSKPRIAYAANRRIGLAGLKLLLEHDCKPALLITPKGRLAEYTEEQKTLLQGTPLIEGKRFREADGMRILKDIGIDYFLSVHFPYIIPQSVLDIPSVGTLNLHPANLPYNRGWHTPTWAIWEQTPYGATLHWIENDVAVDNGSIAIRRELKVRPEETAHELYQRVLALELDVLREAIPLLVNRTLPRFPQENAAVTAHTKNDLGSIQNLDFSESMQVGDTLRLLRALTTNDWREAACFQVDGVKYYAQIDIKREDEI